MKITEHLCKDAIVIDLKAKEKKSAIIELCESLISAKGAPQSPAIIDLVLLREKMASTGIGDGIAILHAKTDSITELVCSVGISHYGIDFDSLDGEPVHILFIVVGPVKARGEQLHLLDKISKICKNILFRQNIIAAKSNDEIINIIVKEDIK